MIIREASRGDVNAIFGLIRELAEYERAPEQVTNTAMQLEIDLFDKKICDAIVAELDSVVVGFALYFTNYSTWKGACLYLEDFYVKAEFRRQGIGEKLFEAVVEIAKQRGVKRMDWQVLEWNDPALSFYRKHNAVLDSEWINGRFFF
jgi:GNAT superfamily N-acetyltransferase